MEKVEIIEPDSESNSVGADHWRSNCLENNWGDAESQGSIPTPTAKR